MKRSNSMWQTVGLLGLLSTLLMIAGFTYAVRSILYSQGSQPSDTVPDQAEIEMIDPDQSIAILALGDSLTKGEGDETGEGYVNRVKTQLEESSGKSVYVWNYAVSGWRTEQLLAEVDKPNIIASIKQADIILLSIGGNDLNQTALGDYLETGDGTTAPELNYSGVEAVLPAAVQRLDTIMTKIAGYNPDAKIIYLGLYHPFLDFDPERQGLALIEEWNHQAVRISNQFPNVTVIPTFDFFQTQLSTYLSSDHFHPNGTGYAQIAARIMQSLK